MKRCSIFELRNKMLVGIIFIFINLKIKSLISSFNLVPINFKNSARKHFIS